MSAKWFFKRWAAFVLALLIFLIPFYWVLKPVDDAYITARYAEQLAAGNGIVFNENENVEGCTAFGMMIFLALVRVLGGQDLVLFAQIAGVVAWGLVCVIALSLMKKKRAEPAVDSKSAEIFGVVFLASCFSALVWAYSGMETPVVAALWIGAVAVHFKEEDKGALPIVSGLLTVMAGLMRPDGILIAVPIALSVLLPLDKKRFTRAAIYSAVVLLLFGGYWAWRWSHFGYLLPNTFYAKVGTQSLRLFVFGVFYVAKGILALGLPLFLFYYIIKANYFRKSKWLFITLNILFIIVFLALGIFLLKGLFILLIPGTILLYFISKDAGKRQFSFLSLGRRGILYGGICVIAIVYTAYVGGDFFPMQRFLIPSLAFWVLFLVELKRLPQVVNEKTEEEEKKKTTGPQMWVKAVAVMVFVNLMCVSVQNQLARHVYISGMTSEWSSLGKYFKARLPKDHQIAAIPIGALGFWSDRYILDMLGLIDLHIAHKEMKTGKGVIGHEKYDTEYILSRRPHLILTWPIYVKPTRTDLFDWTLNHLLSPAQMSFLESVRREGGYHPMAIPMGGNYYVPALVRSDIMSTEPYNSWVTLKGKAREIVLSDPRKLKWVIRKLGQKVAKGDWQRALDRVIRGPATEPRIF